MYNIITILKHCVLGGHILVVAFSPPTHVDSITSRWHHKIHHKIRSHHNIHLQNNNQCQSTLMAESSDSAGEDDDWRAFRAKLVMSESEDTSKSSSSSSSSSTIENTKDTTIIEDEEDLDGFGALFSETSAKGFSPLDPEQWAYDSGKVIEQGAVILGGIEQDFG